VTDDVIAGYAETARLLKEGKRFLLTGHRNPDGDALGSALGLAIAIGNAGKEARVVMRDGWPAAYRVMPGIDGVTVSDVLPADWPGAWDAIFCMECPEPDRTGWPNLFAGNVVNVDHHPGNLRYGAINLVDLPAAAVGEMVADLLDRLDWTITPEIATNLWVSLVSDTGSFRYGNTTPKALALGARLVALGARPAEVGEELFESAPLSALRLETLVLSTLALHDAGRVATLELPARFYAESGAGETETEGLVNRARGIEGVRAAALLKEAAGGVVRCSLRSKGSVDVRSIASTFGGGGHRNAAGCRLAGPLERAREEIVPLRAAAVTNEARP
jgi:phosphoesterase RecJ-like protein